MAAFCFIASILIAIFIFFSINPGSPTVKSTPSVSPVNRQNITPTWQVYSETGYSISYPPDVTITPSIISGGGKALVFHLPEGSNFNMHLEVIPNSITSLDAISGIFRSFKYQEENILINDKSARKFSGALTAGNKTIQETVVVIENQNQIYKLQLTYSDDRKNIKADDLFSQILSSLVFK